MFVSLYSRYGALMWSLGKVLKTPEVMRVYIGSFWDKPYQNTENAKLFDAEREDLLRVHSNVLHNHLYFKIRIYMLFLALVL